jgi:PT repeat
MSSKVFLLLVVLLFQVGSSIGRLPSTHDQDGIDRSYIRRQDRALQTLGSIENLRLINAVTDLPILNLTNGTIINIAQQATSQFNIQATTANGTVRSVRFAYNGRANYRTESSAPFSFCGDGSPNGNYNVCAVLTIGEHNVTATPYSGTGATGLVGKPVRVSFTIVNVPLPPPTKAPTKAPTEAPTRAPTHTPTKSPTNVPTKVPTKAPTNAPTKAPTLQPTASPSKAPVIAISSDFPGPSDAPTKAPTRAPTAPPQPAPLNCTVPKVRALSSSFFLIYFTYN